MKEILKKISDALKLVYGWGIMITLFLGGLTFVGFIIALICGGDAGFAISKFIYKDFFPILIFISSCVVLVGLLGMYLSGEKSLVMKKKEKK